MTAARLRGIHVAVAGDDRDTLDVLTQTLKYDGALVTAHDSARSLARLMQLLVVNVLVVDLADVTDQTLGVIRKVRALRPEEGGRVAIVALYAGPPRVEPRIVAEDVDSIVRKPVDPAELSRIILSVFSASPEGSREGPSGIDARRPE